MYHRWVKKKQLCKCFHPLIIIGCDTTSTFAGRGKRSAWDIWNTLPETTSIFAAFSRVNVFD